MLMYCESQESTLHLGIVFFLPILSVSLQETFEANPDLECVSVLRLRGGIIEPSLKALASKYNVRDLSLNLVLKLGYG